MIGSKDKPSKSAGHKVVPANDSFSWFDEKPKEKQQKSKCTYTDKYGNTVSIGDIEIDYFW